MDNDIVQAVAAFAVLAFVILSVWVVVAGITTLIAKLDFDRIRNYIQSRGGHMKSCRRSESGLRWFGRDPQRVYDVCYSDAGGNEHRVICKTSLFSEVYFTGDCIISGAAPAPPPLPPIRPDVASLKILQEENRQLREEIRRLRSLQDTR